MSERAASTPTRATPTEPAKPVSSQETLELFSAVTALFTASVNLAAALDQIPDTLRRRTSSGERRASSVLRALHYLGMAAQPVKVSDLARGVSVSFGWASRVVDELEAMELTERTRSAEDRRIVHVQLTPSGAALWQRMWRNRQAPIANALARLAPEQREVGIQLINALSAEFERAAREG